MFDLLCKELEITTEQTEKIVERRCVLVCCLCVCVCVCLSQRVADSLTDCDRERIKTLLDQLRESLGLLQSLKDATEKKHASYDHVCGRVQDAAQPKQTVKFLIWITKNADTIAKFIPGFTVRNAPHVPQADFVDALTAASPPSRVPSTASVPCCI
jgi:hypothetical protein